jgi:predicted AlkP superfamily pyrophosphatase or phosphodiesterase
VKKANLPEEFIPPDYLGGSIANIPATIASLLQIPFDGLPGLREPMWQPFSDRVKRVVMLLVDSLGWDMYQRTKPEIDWLASHLGIEEKMTSVFPSTTVAALSSLWTGYAPAQHGLVGLRLFFPQEATLASMLRFSPTFASLPNSLIDAGIKPESFLYVPGFAQSLASYGIKTHSFKGYNIAYSALSRMLDRGVDSTHGVVTAADLFIQLRDLLEETTGQSLYIHAYWPTVDTICHAYGPSHPSVNAEIKDIFNLLKTEFLDRLSPKARKGTVLFVTGDHGHVEAPVEQIINVDDEPTLNEMLLMRPAGEPRTPYLYARQGCQSTLLSYLQEEYPDKLVAMPSIQALTSGLLGPKPHAPDVARRLGDVLATMRQSYNLLTRQELDVPRLMKGRHGGMSAAEMEVPWLGIDLDS